MGFSMDLCGLPPYKMAVGEGEQRNAPYNPDVLVLLPSNRLSSVCSTFLTVPLSRSHSSPCG